MGLRRNVHVVHKKSPSHEIKINYYKVDTLSLLEVIQGPLLN